MKNIEIFDLAVGEIFGRCYESFPVKLKISVTDVILSVAEALPESDSIDPEEFVSRGSEIVFEGFDWLVKSGYLWSSGGTDDLHYYDVCLTPKGLEILKTIPSSLQESESLGELLSRGVKSIGKTSALELVKTSLSLGVKSAFLS